MPPDRKLHTPSQTVGPFFAYGLTPVQYGYDFSEIASGDLILDTSVPGERITIEGRVWDGAGAAVPDAVIEIWQADAEGRYAADPARFHGFGRFGTGTLPDHRFEFRTVKPGPVDGQAPHVNVIVFMRGLLAHAYTRLYFSDEAEANASDPLLNGLDPGRRSTLIAEKRRRADGCTCYTFDIHMQGDRETVFLDV